MKHKLYHGSSKIIKAPMFGVGKRYNDYGLGFYCTESLDMAKGELVERMTSPEFPAEAVTVVPHEPDVVAIAIDNPAHIFRGIVIDLSRPEDPRLESAPEIVCDGETVSFVQRLPYGDSYAVAMRVKGTKAEKRGNTAVIETRDRAEIVLAVRSERNCADPRAAALAAVEGASDAGFAALRARNAAWAGRPRRSSTKRSPCWWPTARPWA